MDRVLRKGINVKVSNKKKDLIIDKVYAHYFDKWGDRSEVVKCSDLEEEMYFSEIGKYGNNTAKIKAWDAGDLMMGFLATIAAVILGVAIGMFAGAIASYCQGVEEVGTTFLSRLVITIFTATVTPVTCYFFYGKIIVDRLLRRNKVFEMACKLGVNRNVFTQESLDNFLGVSTPNEPKDEEVDEKEWLEF